MTDISLIIINWNTKQLLLDCIASLYRTIHRASFEVFVVDNGSADGSVEAVAQKYPGVITIANGRNLGFAAANNMALRRMQGAYAVLLNSDTVMKERSIDGMFEFMQNHPEAGLCGPQLLFADGSKQTSFGTFPDLVSELASASICRLLNPHTRSAREQDTTVPAKVDFIIGACMFVRKTAIEQAGMLDEDYFFFYEEIDWCFRMNRSGWHVFHVPDLEIYHFGGQSTKNLNLRARVESWRSRYLFFTKSRHLGPVRSMMVVMLGFFQTVFRFTGYTLMNLVSFFSIRRLRRRWLMFTYLLLWHLRGMPLSMGLTRD